ncbi:MAG: hypothetical protein HY069_03050 [Chlamydiia bacterium]|nr:hypothetical protein [Chlamydiia bacterium]
MAANVSGAKYIKIPAQSARDEINQIAWREKNREKALAVFEKYVENGTFNLETARECTIGAAQAIAAEFEIKGDPVPAKVEEFYRLYPHTSSRSGYITEQVPKRPDRYVGESREWGGHTWCVQTRRNEFM